MPDLHSPTTRRLVVISDLHIGGNGTPMLGHPDRLVDFLSRLASRKAAAGEEVELVINGDFIDFLAEEPRQAWTKMEVDAEAKLKAVVQRNPEIFKALAACAKTLPRLTLLLGNHDVELAYPRVRARLFRELGTDPHRCLFIYNNESYRVGEVLIEHGNRYDPWNAIDYNGLRETVSAVSRGEEVGGSPSIPPGSYLVEEVMNPLKERYHFVDLLKPEDKLVLLLLSTLEPELKHDLRLVFQAASAYAAQTYRQAVWSLAGSGSAPGQKKLVSRAGDDGLSEDLRAAFAEELKSDTAKQAVGAVSRLRKLFLKNEEQSLKHLLQEKKDIEPKRLSKLQMALRAKLADDRTFDESNDTDPCAKAARSMNEAGAARVVVMGHTHLPRNIQLPKGGRYLNTGTWADVIRLDKAVLEDSPEGRQALVEWLRKLVLDQLGDLRVCEAHFADLSVATESGAIRNERPLLRKHSLGMDIG